MSELNRDEFTHERRKADHIRINLEEDVQFKAVTTGLEKYYFMHRAVPEIDLDAVDTSTSLFGKNLKYTPVNFVHDRWNRTCNGAQSDVG